MVFLPRFWTAATIFKGQQSFNFSWTKPDKTVGPKNVPEPGDIHD